MPHVARIRPLAPFSRSRFLLAALTLTLPLLATAPAGAATPGDQAGVRADGMIRSAYLPCYSLSCDGAYDDLDSQSKNHRGSFGPVIVDGYATQGTGTASFYARALITGPLGLPTLGAQAEANPGVGTHDGYSGEGAYFFAVNASAQTVQYFAFNGLAPERYTLDFTLSGGTGSTLDNPTDTDFALIQASGGLALFDDGDKLGGELPMGGSVDFDMAQVNGSAGENFRKSGSVSILLNPGDHYYLSAFVTANVGLLGYGYADVSHSLTVEFVEGDTSLLTPLLLPVPEPSRTALAALGLLALGWQLRQRRR